MKTNPSSEKTTHRSWFITGVNSGFGRNMTEQLLARGDCVAGTVRKMDAMNDLKAKYGDKLWLARLDVTDTPKIRVVVNKAFADLGNIDVVVNNAGYGLFGAAEELTDDQILQQINTNLIGSIQVVRAALPHLRKQGGGRFLFTSSVTGPNVAMPGTAHYAASKCGLNGLIRTAALEYARQNITVNGVEPGYILTPAMDALGGPEALAQMATQIPLGKLGMPADIANTMLFLASDAAAYITGQTIVVDGGSTLPESPVVLEAFYQGQ